MVVLMEYRFSPDRAKQARELQGLTQFALAEAVDVDPSSIRHWEKGRRVPSADHLFALAAALGVPPEGLMARKPATTNKKKKKG